MLNLNESEKSFIHLIPNKFLKQRPIFFIQFQVFVDNVIHKDLKLKWFGVTLQKPL